MMNIDGASVLHAAREESVSGGAEDHNLQYDKILTNRLRVLPLQEA